MKRYYPLIAIIGVSLLSAFALSSKTFAFSEVMQNFMGIFLVFFATLKLFNISGFVEGFRRYDLLAKHVRAYGFCYPFIELALGLGYLSSSGDWVYYATIPIMGLGAAGVLVALKKGLKTCCACMGTSLNVPLSTVAVIENISMVIMAICMICF